MLSVRFCTTFATVLFLFVITINGIIAIFRGKTICFRNGLGLCDKSETKKQVRVRYRGLYNIWWKKMNGDVLTDQYRYKGEDTSCGGVSEKTLVCMCWNLHLSCSSGSCCRHVVPIILAYLRDFYHNWISDLYWYWSPFSKHHLLHACKCSMNNPV